MWYHWLAIVCLYAAITWYSLHQSASPVRTCPAGDDRHCVYPLVSPGDPLIMELWIYAPPRETIQQNATTATTSTTATDDDRSVSRSLSSSYEWRPIETCRFNVNIPTSGILPIEVTKRNDTASGAGTSSSHSTCMVLLPNSARQRSSSSKTAGKSASSPPRPLQAIFRVKSSDGLMLIGDIPFEITRIIEKKEAFFWSSRSTATDGSSPRNLLEDPLALSTKRNNNNTDTQPKGPQWVPYLKYGRSASVNIRIVAEYRPYGELLLLRQDGATLSAWNRSNYRPIMYIDDKSVQHGAHIELAPPENGKPPIQLRVKVSALSPVMDSLNRQMIQALEMGESILPGPELDEIRYFLQDERLYRFALTQIISYIHMWFDYMAFRDEIHFYRGRESLAGVSTSSVVTRFLCSFIILLYLLDGGGTSWVVLLSLGSSCAVEAWKVWRLLRPRWQRQFPFVAVRVLETTVEQDTATYDRIAVANLTMILYPLVVGWSLYALRHYTYKSWYSWLVSNLANAVYTFGFIALCPQLYVNYRLKSVAHLPWKVFLYKIFNTFVDDAFAWLIEMPWKHRIMTLRDDVVFIMLLVQVYVYRVDKSRTNEFGYAYEQDNGEEGNGDKKNERPTLLLHQQEGQAADTGNGMTVQGGARLIEPLDQQDGSKIEKMDKLD